MGVFTPNAGKVWEIIRQTAALFENCLGFTLQLTSISPVVSKGFHICLCAQGVKTFANERLMRQSLKAMMNANFLMQIAIFKS